jgi:glycosyltransferase involved in cell wall biosynthesis
MTAFNREKYIAEAIDSVLASSYTNFELIIVDDCSADNTYSIAKTFAEKDDRIRLYRNESNRGQFGNRNYAASLAAGEYIKYLDSDDKIRSDGLMIMVESMLKFPDAGAGSEYQLKTDRQLPCVFSSRESYINHYFKGSSLLFNGPTATILKKEIFAKLGGFPEDMGILADTLLMLRIAAVTSVVGLPPNLIYWRIHEQQVTIGQRRTVEMIRERHLINKAAIESPDCPFTANERHLVFRNLKNILIRRVLTKRDISFKEIIELAKLKKINFSDVFLAALPNSKIEK